MKKKPMIVCLAMLLVCSLVLAACGTKEEPPKSDEKQDVSVFGDNKATEAPDPTATPEPTKEPSVDDVPVVGVPGITGDVTPTPEPTEPPAATDAPKPTEAPKAEGKTFNFKDLNVAQVYGTEATTNGDGSVSLTYDGQYQEIKYSLPDTIDMSNCKKVTLKYSSEEAGLCIKLYDANLTELFVQYGITGSGEIELNPAITDKVSAVGLMANDSAMTASVTSIFFDVEAGSAAPEPTKAPVAPAEPSEVSEMVKRSLLQTGNTYRLKRAIEKAKNGEEVVIAYIGGSVTEGQGASPNSNCYAYQSYQYFKNTFANGGDNVKFVNAGMSGTPSTIGMIRYDRDVVAKYGEPDILFVEFAVNDGDDPTSGVCFESLVKDALMSESEPAVVLVFSVFQSQWNLQSRLAPVGYHYDLPMVSISDAVLPEIKSGALSNADFFSDVYHPNNGGYRIMADCVNYLFDVVNSEAGSASDITIPSTPKIGDDFVGVKMIDSSTNDSNVTITPGSFSSKDNGVGTFLYATSTKTFPDNWMKNTTATGDGFKMEVNCKNLVLLYKSSNSQSYGKADIYVDGTKVATVSGYATGGWNNPLLKILIDDDTAAKHTVEVKMADGEEGKAFTIYGFGYTK